jgi:hypothetical protein
MFVCLEADQAALKFRLVCRGAGEGGGGSTSFVAGVAQLSNFYLHLAKSTGRVEPHQRALRSLASRRVCSRFDMMTRTSSFSPIAEHWCQPLHSISDFESWIALNAHPTHWDCSFYFGSSGNLHLPSSRAKQEAIHSACCEVLFSGARHGQGQGSSSRKHWRGHSSRRPRIHSTCATRPQPDQMNPRSPI